MPTEDQVRELCHPQTFQRALGVLASSKLHDLRAGDAFGDIVLSAQCRGSSPHDSYQVEAVISPVAGNDEIVDYTCSCPAYFNYEGMCKHCAALVLAYLRAPKSFALAGADADGAQAHDAVGTRQHDASGTLPHDGSDPLQHDASDTLSHSASGTLPRGLKRSKPTSARLADMMHRANASRSPGEPHGEIDLLPELVYSYGDWSVRFKIAGPSGSYVLKSIAEFLMRLRNGERHAYGKKLAFTHVSAALTDRARAIAGILERAVETRGQAGGWWKRSPYANVERDLALTETELVELLDALLGSEIEITRAESYRRLTVRVHVTDEPFDAGISLVPEEGGYVVSAPDDAVVIRSDAGMYVWIGGAFHRCPDEMGACADFLAAALDREADRLFVALDDLPLFCATLLPAIEGPLGLEVPVELQALKPVPCELRFYFDREGKDVTCEARAAYRGKEMRVGTEQGVEEDGGTGDGRHVWGAALPADTGLPGDCPSRLREAAGAPPLAPLRDAAKESEAEALVERYFGPGWLPAAARLPLDAEAEVADLLFGGLAEFRALGEVHVTPAFERLLRDKSVRISIGVSLAGDLLNLEVSADDLPPAELAALLASYRKRKRYHRLRDGAFLNLAECDLAQLDRIARDLGVTQAQLASGRIELPSFRAFYLDEEADLERDRSFTRYLDRFRAVNEEAYAVPPSLEDVLRPYQAEGFRWLSARCDAGFGGILADEMGLGKSMQVIALLLARRNEEGNASEIAGVKAAKASTELAESADPAEPQAGAGGEALPSLIVCPASLVYNWVAECARFAPELRVRALAGSKRERMRLLALAPKANDAGADPKADAAGPDEDAAEEAANDGIIASAENDALGDGPAAPCPYDALVISYDTLRADVDAFAARSFKFCILDEAQYIKNPATRITRAAKRIRARHRFALTGTPMENRLSDLWSIFDFLMPGILGPYTRFRERFELAIAGGDEDAAARLRKLVGPFMLRRRKEDVLSDLPEKLESVVRVPLEGEQRALYLACEQQLRERLTEQKRVKGGRGKAKPITPEARAAAATAAAAGDDFAKHRVEILAELTKLRQICCDPALLYDGYAGPAAKLRAIADLVESARDADEKVLVFSQFTGFLDLIAQQLDARGIAHYSITGATPKRRRLELVDAFNRDDTPAFLISLKAGGTGLNLTGASVVIHADPWWNAAAQNQATDRTHRIGQTRTVTVQKVIAEGTIEERILRLQEAKAELADQVIGASGTSLAGLSREDLLELLG